MVAVGQGAQAAVKEVFATLGANSLVLSNGSGKTTMGPSAGASGGASITWDDCNSVATEVSTVNLVAPVLETRGTQLVSEHGNWNAGVVGTNATWVPIRAYDAAHGT